jgi:hypothetical protein
LAGDVAITVAAVEREENETPKAAEVLIETAGDDGAWSVALGIGKGWLRDPRRIVGEAFTVLMAVFTERSLLPLARLEEVVGDAAQSGALGNLFAGRAFDELVTLFDDLPRLTAEVGPPWHSDPLTHEALQWQDGPGPTYDPEAAKRDLESRYKKLPAMCQVTLPRILEDETVRATIDRLRADGWLDWQILQAIHGVITKHRAPDDILEWPRERIERVFMGPEDDTLDPVPIEAFSEEKLREAATTGMVATLQVVGLEPHSPRPDMAAIRSLLIRRYNYLADDVEHPDPFARSQ